MKNQLMYYDRRDVQWLLSTSPVGWVYTSENYDGESDSNTYGTGLTVQDCINQIIESGEQLYDFDHLEVIVMAAKIIEFQGFVLLGRNETNVVQVNDIDQFTSYIKETNYRLGYNVRWKPDTDNKLCLIMPKTSKS